MGFNSGFKGLTGYLSFGRRRGGDRANTWHWKPKTT